jgi:hypothetical protein
MIVTSERRMRLQCNLDCPIGNFIFRIIAALTAINIILVGCSSIKVIPGISPREAVHRPVAIHFFAEAHVYEDCTEELATLEERVAKLADSLHVLPGLTLGPCREECAETITARAVITHISKSTELGYALYGGNEVRLWVEFSESDTGEKITTFEIIAKKGETVGLMYHCAWRIIKQFEKLFAGRAPSGPMK